MQKCFALFLWLVNKIMKRKTVVWNWYPIDEIDLAKEIGFDLLPGCIITNDYYDVNNANKDDFNVIIINHFFGKTIKQRTMEDLSWADLVVHYTPEIIYGPWEDYQETIIKHFNNKNFITVCNGVVDMPHYPAARVYKDAQTFFTRVARYCPAVKLAKTTVEKPIMFDALLGKKDLRRDKVFRSLKDNNLLGDNLVNYYEEQGQDATSIYRSTDLYSIDDNPITGFSTYPATPGGVPRSHMVPHEIYNRTWFSVVAETNSRTTFMTEKTAKCLLSGRMFVMLGEKGHMAKLQSYGYKTFSTHIDESYDDIDNEDERIRQALAQVKLLTQRKDLGAVMTQLHETFVHNQKKCIDNTDRLDRLRKFLLPYCVGKL